MTVTGAPQLGLKIGTETRQAAYAGGSGTNRLVFAWTVLSDDTDPNGVSIDANALALNGGTVLGADGGTALLAHGAVAADAAHKVDGSKSPAGTGICGRTPAVRDALLARARNLEDDDTLTCSGVTDGLLGRIAGTLDVSRHALSGRMTALTAGDFAKLTAVTRLVLDYHALKAFPAGVFDPLTALTELSMSYNQTQAADALMTLPAGLFDKLTGLRVLELAHNDLATLPDGLFQKLVNLETLKLEGNPGSARFVPAPNPGPEAGLDAQGGATVTLGGTPGSDPWGSNVTWEWTRVSGPEVELSATDIARPTFAAPFAAEASEIVFELAVSLEVGVRHDGGDAETGFGLDLGGGLSLSDPERGLQAELRGRGLLSHESKGFRERGFSGSLAWEQKPGSERGARLTLSQTVGGSASGGADALLARGTLEGLATNDNGDGGDLKSRRLELKLGYGLSAFGDRFTWTPEAGFGLSDTGRDYSLGWRLVRRSSAGDIGSLELAVEATRRESDNPDSGTGAEHTVGLRLTARW